MVRETIKKVSYDFPPRQGPPTCKIVDQEVDTAVDSEEKVRYRKESGHELVVSKKIFYSNIILFTFTSGGYPIISKTLGTIFKE